MQELEATFLEQTILEYLKFKSKNCNSAKKVQSASHKSEVVREVLEPLHSTYTKEKSGEFHHAECVVHCSGSYLI